MVYIPYMVQGPSKTISGIRRTYTQIVKQSGFTSLASTQAVDASETQAM